MKFNDKEIAQLSESKCDLEGRLNYSRPKFNQNGCKERWFKLKSNLLYYFDISDTGKVNTKQPLGLLVLEQCQIQLEMQTAMPFAFCIVFQNDWDRRHVFSGRSEEHVLEWINVLKTASYEYWRTQLFRLQKRISLRTGKDPLFMVPRNKGCGDHFMQQTGFQCHLPAQESSWVTFEDNALIKFSPEKKPEAKPFDNSWEFFENLNFGQDNHKNNNVQSRAQSVGRFNPFDTNLALPQPPRRSKSPKLLRSQVLANELHRTKSDSRIHDRPIAPLRKKSLGSKQGSKFYLSDDDDSDNSVTINPIYQSTSEIVYDFNNKKPDNDKCTEVNLIDL